MGAHGVYRGLQGVLRGMAQGLGLSPFGVGILKRLRTV